MRRLQIPYQGQMVDVIEHDFKITAPENWNEYELLDGGRVKVKTVVTRVFVRINTEGQSIRDADGELQVIVKANNVVIATDDVQGGGR